MKNEEPMMSLEDAQKSPVVRAEAIEFLLETAAIAATSNNSGMPPMMILEMASAALQVIGVTDDELNSTTKKMVDDRLARVLGGFNGN